VANFWEQLLGGGAAGAGYYDLYKNLDKQKGDIGNQIGEMQQGLQDRTQFTPWTISGGVGNVSGGPGGMSFGLNKMQNALAGSMFNRGNEMLGRSMQDIAPRTQDLYEQMRATQMPGEQRQLQNLSQQMMSQGRSGMGTTEFGSSPERFAFEKARAEADNSAYLGARQGAMGEQLQNYNMGLGMTQQGYMPYDYMFKQAGLGLNNQQLAQQGQLENANLWTQLGLGGMTAKQNYGNMQSQMLRDLYKTAAPMAGGIGSGVDDYFKRDDTPSGLWDYISGLFT
jgi:hypothetical protein